MLPTLGLPDHSDIADGRIWILAFSVLLEILHHVPNIQQCRGDPSESLHFDPSLVLSRNGAFCDERAALELNLNLDRCKRDEVAERQCRGRRLCRLDPNELR